MIIIIDNTVGKSHEYLDKLAAFLEINRIPFWKVASTEELDDATIRFHPSAYILSGSALRAEDAPYNVVLLNARAIANAVRQDIPVVGICFGAQLIQMIFGGKLRKGTLVCRVRTVRSERSVRSALALIKDDFEAQFCLHDTITRLVTPLDVLATANVRGRNHSATPVAFKHRQYPIYGCLFHPEALSSTHTILRELLHI